MADEFKLKEVKTEIKQKLDSLFYELKDAQKVYQEINRKGHEVGYPEIVAHLQHHPVARTLPLDHKYKDKTVNKKNKNKKLKGHPLNHKVNNAFINEKKLVKDIPARELHTTFATLLQIKAKEQGWAYEQAVIFDSITSRQYNIEKTIRVLQAYQKRTETGQPYNSAAIAEETNTKRRTTRNILERLNLVPKIKIKIDSELEQAIKNATEIEDVGEKHASHFLRIPINELREYIKKNKLRFAFVTNCYLHASKTYEAQDAGFNNKETAEYAGIMQRNLKYIISNRKEFEPKIIEILKKIYPNKEITKPYI